jgi:hypothetical protein
LIFTMCSVEGCKERPDHRGACPVHGCICAEHRVQCNLTRSGSTTRKYRPYPPRYKYAFKVRFSEGSGRLKHTPSKADPDHHDFYKADEFTASSVSVGDGLELALCLI